MRNIHLHLTRAVLFAAGSVSLIIGVAITFLTQGFYAGTGIDLHDNASLFSEIRASGAVLLVVAVYLLVALVRPAWQLSALLVSVVYFGAYGLARLYSALSFGWPTREINTAMAAELAVCALAAVLVVRAK
jgi:hypothetical protein